MAASGAAGTTRLIRHGVVALHRVEESAAGQLNAPCHQRRSSFRSFAPCQQQLFLLFQEGRPTVTGNPIYPTGTNKHDLSASVLRSLPVVSQRLLTIQDRY